jgi:hypothetical protein
LNKQDEALSYLRLGLKIAPEKFIFADMKNEEGLKNLKKNKDYKKILRAIRKSEKGKKKA